MVTCRMLTKKLLANFCKKHLEKNAAISFVTTHNPQPSPSSYGRIIVQENAVKIIEAKDLKDEQYESCCINAGIYIFKKEFLEKHLSMLNNTNNAQEFYITDLVKIGSDLGLKIETINASFDHIRGINTFKELWIAEQIKRSELISYWMKQGVRFDVAQSTHIDANVTIGNGTRIGAGVNLLNSTNIGKNCIIEPFCIIDQTLISDNVTIKSHSVLNNVKIENNAILGPFAHIRNKSTIKESAQIGNFVEVNRSTIGKESKAKHLTYLGDTTIGIQSNIGAGTITCNYNGKEKYQTIIKDHVFIGSNNTLVAPVTIEKDSYTAAGSTITKNVPTKALAIARSRQTNKEGYAEKIIAKKK